jgi:threonine dehydrogenase-like Zn-dependent dehydrogenase
VLSTIEAGEAAPGSHTVIIGGGFKALLAVMLIKRLSDPKSVILVSNRVQVLELAQHLGATLAVSPKDLVPAVGQVTEGQGAALAYELTGTDAGLGFAAGSLGGGRLVVGVSQVQPRRLTQLYNHLQQRNIVHVQADAPDVDSRLGAMGGAVELLNKGGIDLGPLVATYPLERVAEAFQAAANGPRKVVVRP